MKKIDFLISRFLDVLLIAVAAVWSFGVDTYPILQWIGMPIFILMFWVWAIFSDSLVKIMEWCNDHIKEEGDDESK